MTDAFRYYLKQEVLGALPSTTRRAAALGTDRSDNISGRHARFHNGLVKAVCTQCA